jgi:hypothetical protein
MADERLWRHNSLHRKILVLESAARPEIPALKPAAPAGAATEVCITRIYVTVPASDIQADPL